MFAWLFILEHIIMAFKSKLFHKTEERSQVGSQMRQEVEVRILRNVFVNPDDSLCS